MAIKDPSNNKESALENAFREREEEILSILRTAFSERREIFTAALAKLIFEKLTEGTLQLGAAASSGKWEIIVSLSQLRKIAKGRFDTVKKFWTDAGFPLKSKKGEKVKDYKLNEAGWENLRVWLLKQGLQCELCSDEEEGFFKVKKSPV